MAALLSAAKLTAIEGKISSLVKLADDIRDELNGLYSTKKENAQHAAWPALAQARKHIQDAALALREVVIRNSDAFGKGY